MPFWKNPGTASKSARTEGAEVWYSLAVGATGLGAGMFARAPPKVGSPISRYSTLHILQIGPKSAKCTVSI
jgi:hypothetical protein